MVGKEDDRVESVWEEMRMTGRRVSGRKGG